MAPSYKDNDPKGWCGDPSRGAALGRGDIHTEGFSGVLHLRRVLIDKDGYDENGTYFGTGQPLYWYASGGGEVDAVLRARDREEAKATILGQCNGTHVLNEERTGFLLDGVPTYPNATFAPDANEDMIAEIFDGYVTAALWSSNDNADESGGEPLDKNYSVDDLADGTRREMRDDVERFFLNYRELILKVVYPGKIECSDLENVGHDLWLTANGHGCGFWDGGCQPSEVGKLLAEAARGVGGTDLYVGDDGKIYC